MFKGIAFNNFRSFGTDGYFSLEAEESKVSEHPHHVQSVGDGKLLRLAGIFGPNGGGKSNLLKAILLPVRLFKENNPAYHDEEIPNIFLPPSPIVITLVFLNEDGEFRFQIKATTKRTYEEGEAQTRLQIQEEEVDFRPIGHDEFALLYHRNADGRVEFGEDGPKSPSPNIGESGLYLKWAYEAFAANPAIKDPFSRRLRSLGKELEAFVYLNRGYRLYIGTELKAFIEANKPNLLSALHSADLSIKDVKIELNEQGHLYFLRESRGQTAWIEGSNESKGTKLYFSLILSILSNKGRRRVYLIDDLNAYFHPALSKAIIRHFGDVPTQDQFIFTSQNVLDMDNDLLRRDEVYIVYRDDDYDSHVFSIADLRIEGRQVRKDAKMYKQYLEGRYGGDPFISKTLKL